MSAPAQRAPRQVVLVSNGPGELYTWVRPTLEALRRADPDVRVVISLIPCQFATGSEPAIAAGFGADAVTTASEYVRAAAAGRAPAALRDAERSVVVSMGGNGGLAATLARRLGTVALRYSFVPYLHPGIRLLMVHDQATRRTARLLGLSTARVEAIGNLVADAVRAAEPVPDPGDPHVLLFGGSRDAFALHLIPFMIALVDRLAPRYPRARFVWPVSRLLSHATVAAGIEGRAAATLGGTGGTRVGDTVVTPGGAVIELVDEAARYAHMRAATTAVTIPGTNTLELGIAGVPAVVVLPLNRPEVIPLEGPGHWLSLLPLVGVPLKRRAVKLFVERLDQPVSLPNRFSGETLMTEIKGIVSVAQVADAVAALLDDGSERSRRRDRLAATMPPPGAAERLVRRVYDEVGWAIAEHAAPQPAARS
jgi:hypothetical protein